MMFSDFSLAILLAIFAAASGVILLCGVRMTGLADRIADRTGLGEALIGGVLLGAATSLSGTVVSVTAALDGRASLAFSNGVGGIAAQTAFLALADLLHRRANLEHAAAELANVFQGALLILLLAIPILAYAGPDVTIFGSHPASYILVIVYITGVIASKRVREQPMWTPVGTTATEDDQPDEDQKDTGGNLPLFAWFGGLMLVMGGAGWTIAQVASELTDRYSLSASLVGALMTAVATSLPELVTTFAAVRRGALQLAVGGIIGGNTFDTLFLTLSDLSYRDGSLYHALTPNDFFWLATGLVLTSILLLGLIVRQRTGPGGIGFESAGVLTVYAGAIAVQAFAM
ncbi:sodium:calcium antiporter [Hoeflea sp. AS60]|uniref:sodium:calcium antiporter n=1 Tax=Hoeflea sp. AS60 TaxID=3135780 RepID=UPI003176A05C